MPGNDVFAWSAGDTNVKANARPAARRIVVFTKLRGRAAMHVPSAVHPANVHCYLSFGCVSRGPSMGCDPSAFGNRKTTSGIRKVPTQRSVTISHRGVALAPGVGCTEVASWPRGKLGHGRRSEERRVG